jgi:hypothetical protein
MCVSECDCSKFCLTWRRCCWKEETQKSYGTKFNKLNHCRYGFLSFHSDDIDIYFFMIIAVSDIGPHQNHIRSNFWIELSKWDENMSLMITTAAAAYIVSSIKSNDYFPVDPNDPPVMSYYHQNSRFYSLISFSSCFKALFSLSKCVYNSKANNAEIYDIYSQEK